MLLKNTILSLKDFLACTILFILKVNPGCKIVHIYSTIYLSGRQGEEEFSVKPPRSPESGVNGIYSVSGSYDDDLPPTVQPILYIV